MFLITPGLPRELPNAIRNKIEVDIINSILMRAESEGIVTSSEMNELVVAAEAKENARQEKIRERRAAERESNQAAVEEIHARIEQGQFDNLPVVTYRLEPW
jgi:hypothetical protein